MKPVIVVVFVIALAFSIYKKASTREVKQLSFSSLSSREEINQCTTKDDCIVAYIAPWCPACHQFIAQYKEHEKMYQQKNINVVFIVGADEDRTKEENLKNGLGQMAVLDSVNHDFMKQHQINSFPSLFLIDKNGKIREQSREVVKYINAKFNQR